MRKSRILSILLALLISISVFSGVLGCGFMDEDVFTVTFVGGEGAVLVKGKAVQKITDAEQIQPPVFEKPGATFDSWSHVLKDITKDTTVEAIWYIGYKVELNDSYYDAKRRKEIDIGYGDRGTVKVPYGSTLGPNGPLFPNPYIGNGDYEFLRWDIVLDNGEVFPLTEATIFNDELFVGFGLSTDEAFNYRGKILTVNPILKYIGRYTPLN